MNLMCHNLEEYFPGNLTNATAKDNHSARQQFLHLFIDVITVLFVDVVFVKAGKSVLK